MGSVSAITKHFQIKGLKLRHVSLFVIRMKGHIKKVEQNWATCSMINTISIMPFTVEEFSYSAESLKQRPTHSKKVPHIYKYLIAWMFCRRRAAVGSSKRDRDDVVIVNVWRVPLKKKKIPQRKIYNILKTARGQKPLREQVKKIFVCFRIT